MSTPGAKASLRTGMMKWSRPVLAQWSGTIYVSGVSLGLSILLARIMGPEKFGEYYYLLNLATLLAVWQNAGFRTLILRERVAATAGLAGDLPALAMTHLLAVSALMIAGALWLSSHTGAYGLPWAIACFGAIALTYLVSAQLKGAGEFVREASWQVLARSVSALLIVLVVVYIDTRPAAIFAAWSIGLLLAFAWIRVRWRGRMDLRPPAIHRLRNGRAYRAAASFLWIDLAIAAYSRTDIVILHHLLGAAPEVGGYAAAYRLFDGVLLLVAPIALMFFRELRLLRGDGEAARKLGARTLLAAALLGIALAIGGWSLGPAALSLLYGERYAAESGMLTGWLFSAFVFALPNYVLTQIAIATHRERWYAICASLAALTNIALNFALVPVHGATGAAWAMLATEGVLGLTLLAGIWRNDSLKPSASSPARAG